MGDIEGEVQAANAYLAEHQQYERDLHARIDLGKKFIKELGART